MATQKFFKGLKGSAPKVVSAQDIDDIAEKLHQTTATTNVSATAELTTTQKKSNRKPENKKKSATPAPAVREGHHRLTLDIPDELFEQAKYYKTRSGVTLKGLVVALLYDFFEQQAEQPAARLVRRG